MKHHQQINKLNKGGCTSVLTFESLKKKTIFTARIYSLYLFTEIIFEYLKFFVDVDLFSGQQESQDIHMNVSA